MKIQRKIANENSHTCVKCGSEEFTKENCSYYCQKCYWHVHNLKQKKLIEKYAKLKIINTHRHSISGV